MNNENDPSLIPNLFSRRDFLKTTGLGLSGAALWAITARTGLASVSGANAAADAATKLTIQTGNPGPVIPSTLYGAFFEEINFGGVGGLYAELLRNRGFNEDSNNPVHWSLVAEGSSAGSFQLDTHVPLNDAHPRSLRLDIEHAGAGGRVGIANEGYWGIPVAPKATDPIQAIKQYTARLFTRCSEGYRGGLRLTVESLDGTQIYASGRIRRLNTQWRAMSVVMQVDKSVPATMDARFVVTADGSASANQSIWFGYVSLFPPTYKNRPNGNRRDIMEKLVAMAPGIFRFPGGNYLEGNTIATRFDWEKTIGAPWQRPGHQNTAWGYWSDDGLGLLEFLEITEDLGASAVLGIWAGYTLNGTVVVPESELQPYIESALNEIEYVIGSPATTWGARRAADGHPEPFELKFVEIGNEDFFDNSGSYNDYRFPMFYDAIKARYPDIQIIATTAVNSRPADIIDDHYYNNPQYFVNNSHLYDNRPAGDPKVFVGEYAVNTQGKPPTGTLGGAVGEAAFMTGFERNANSVIMSSYAPLLVREGHRQWPTNLVAFDGLTSYGSPSYYTQKMFARNTGDVVLPIDGPQPTIIKPVSGTWYHLVGVYDREAQQLKLYIDGQLVDTVDYPNTDAWQGTGHLEFGRGLYGGNPVDFVNGQIDDVRLYDRALDDQDVVNLPDRGLIGHWAFDTGSGTTAKDSAGGNAGKLVNGAGWTAGRVGPYALDLNGNRQYVDVDTPVVNTAQSFSVAAWVKLNNTDGYQTFVSVDGNNVSVFYLQKRADTNGFALTRIPTDAAGPGMIASSTSAGDFQYVASRDRDTGKIFIKAANASSSPQRVEFDLPDVHASAFDGTATTLTANSPSAQNTLDKPGNVVPVDKAITVNRNFEYVFEPNSVTVLALNVGPMAQNT